MKKTAIKTQEEQALEEQNHLIDDEHWYLDTAQTKSKSNEYMILFLYIWKFFLYLYINYKDD